MNLHSNLSDLNWDFAGESGALGLANFHWYPGRFVPQLASLLIGNLTRPGDKVLDPFCGSGTALVEAHRLGRRVVGIDINPIATMIARAKLQPWDAAVFGREMAELRDRVGSQIRIGLFSEDVASPFAAENGDWYHQQTLAELKAIWTELTRTRTAYDVVFRTAFSSILRTACSQQKHWGWICDNVKPKKLTYRPALRLFEQKCKDYAVAVDELERDSQRYAALHTGVRSEARIHRGQAQRVLRSFDAGTFDALITSPPYYSMTDYSQSQRLSFLWFEEELDEVRPHETGARFKRFRKSARQQYLDEMREIFIEIGRVLRPGAFCAVVAGESLAREPYVDELLEIAASVGLIRELAIDRRVSVRRTIASHNDSESIVILRKAG